MLEAAVPALAEISARAATLDEILTEGGLATSPQQAAEMLEAWASACAGGDQAAFDRRLAWDGLDRARVLNALCAAPGPIAPWTRWLPRFAAAASECAADLQTGRGLEEWPSPPTPDEPPFAELLAPAMRTARRALDDLAGDSLAAFDQRARADLMRQLARELAHASELGYLEFLHAFQRSRGLAGSYRGFVRAQLGAGLPLLFAALPGLARAQAELVESWCGTTAELAVRLERDRPSIESTLAGGRPLGAVVGVEAGLSDRHDGGRRVCVLRFESGLRVVYKPREIGLEVDLHALIGWARDRGLASLPLPLPMVARAGYGFMAHADFAECADRAELAAYHAAAGGLLFCAHLLRIRDLHNENVIATRGGPALVDAEALGQPAEPAELGQVGALDRTAALRAESCLATGLLTLPQVGADGSAYDIGGLRASPERRAPLARRVWHGQRTDALGFTADDRSPPRSRSAAHHDGRPVPPEEHAAELARGFAEAYRFFRTRTEALFADGGPLAQLGDRATRLIFRPSDQYAMLLHVLAAPRYQRSGFRRSISIDALNRVFSREAVRPRLWPLTGDERAELDARDIPRFTLKLNECEPSARGGEPVRGLFASSGLEAVRRRAASLCEADLEAQLEWIGAALQPLPSHVSLAAEEAAEGERAPAGAPPPFREAATAIGEELLRRAVRGRTGLAWRGLGRGQTEGALDLYDGLAGVTLFLAALFRDTADPRFEEAARASLEALTDALAETAPGGEPGGAMSGPASIANALAHVGRSLGEPRLGTLAVEVMLRSAGPGLGLDVAGGGAGLLLVALGLGAGRDGAPLSEHAESIALRLCAAQIIDGADAGGWPTGGARPAAGYAHGAAGIALALALAGERFGREDWLAAARAGIRFLDRAYDAAESNWPLLRADGGRTVLTAWCHGAAGIALACSALPATARDATSESVLARAVATTAKANGTRHDHPCCGTIGRAEALLVAGTRRQRPDWEAHARGLAAEVAWRVRRAGPRAARPAGYQSGPARPGYFQGLAGIGHGLLRFADPHDVASVLAPGDL